MPGRYWPRPEISPSSTGIAGNKEVTLIDAYSAGSTRYGMGFPMAGPAEQTLKAQTALVGVHVEGAEHAVFTRANFSIEDAWLWSSESAMAATMVWNEAGSRLTGEASIQLKPVAGPARRDPGGRNHFEPLADPAHL